MLKAPRLLFENTSMGAIQETNRDSVTKNTYTKTTNLYIGFREVFETNGFNFGGTTGIFDCLFIHHFCLNNVTKNLTGFYRENWNADGIREVSTICVRVWRIKRETGKLNAISEVAKKEPHIPLHEKIKVFENLALEVKVSFLDSNSCLP